MPNQHSIFFFTQLLCSPGGRPSPSPKSFSLLAGTGVDIAGVFFTVGPFEVIAALEEMVVDLGDAAGAGTALEAHVGLEIGHARLSWAGAVS